jgi:hypothetical protein
MTVYQVGIRKARRPRPTISFWKLVQPEVMYAEGDIVSSSDESEA